MRRRTLTNRDMRIKNTAMMAAAAFLSAAPAFADAGVEVTAHDGTATSLPLSTGTKIVFGDGVTVSIPRHRALHFVRIRLAIALRSWVPTSFPLASQSIRSPEPAGLKSAHGTARAWMPQHSPPEFIF